MTSVLSSSPISLEEVEDPADLVVGVREEAGEDLHHPGVEPALVGRQRVPLAARRGRGATARCPAATMPELLLARERPRSRYASQPSSNWPAYLSAHSLRHVVRRVAGARCEVQEERLVGRDLRARP